MTLRPFRVLPVLAGSLVLATGGCGGSGDGALSKSELIEKADAICKRVNAKTAGLPTPAGFGSAASTLGKTVTILVTADGRIVYVHTGALDAPALRRLIQRHLEV